MKILTISILSTVAATSLAHAATLITTGETIDPTGATRSIAPNTPGAVNLVTHNGGGSFTIAAAPINNDFYISYINSNVDPDLYDYLQIDFAAGMTETSPVNFQLYLANGNTYAGGDLAANVTVTPSSGAFSILFDLTGSASWDILKNGGAGGNDIDGVRLDTFNGAAYTGESFTITRITFGDTLLAPVAVPEPSTTLLTGIVGLSLLLRRKRI